MSLKALCSGFFYSGNFFSELPTDMWNEIFKFITPLDVICIMSNVCDSWRKTIVKYYFQNYLSKHSNFLNIKDTEELFNNKNLLKKYKRYLFRQHIKQVALRLATLSQPEEKTDNYSNSSTYFFKNQQFIDLEIADMNIYCNLFSLPLDTEPLKLSNYRKPSTNTVATTTASTKSSCYGFYSNNNQVQTSNSDLNNTLAVDNKDKIYILKAVMIGHAGIGKTSFIEASVNKQFQNSFMPTIGCDFSMKTHKLGEGNSTKLQIWDVCGPERFRSITSSYYRGASGFFLCFDLTKRESFNDVLHWKEEITKYTAEKTTIETLLLGTKSDLKDHQVKREEAEKLGFELELTYFETSSKEMKNVDSPTWFLVLMQHCFNQFKRM